MKHLFVILALVLCFAPVTQAQIPNAPPIIEPPVLVHTKHEWGHPLLNKTASFYAKRKVAVKCRSSLEDSDLFFALGYVLMPAEKQKWAVLDELVCAGALSIKSDTPDTPDLVKAAGAAVLIHEAFHLKRFKIVEESWDEAKTECRALLNYDKGLTRLGASKTTLVRLMPTLLLFHLQLIMRAEEYYTACPMPERYQPYLDGSNILIR